MTGTERPIRPWRTTPAARLIALVTATALVGAGAPAHAQQKGPPVVRDAEIEQLLREYTQPVLRAAGLAQQNVQVVIINDRSFNAFVADGRRIFVNGGALMEAGPSIAIQNTMFGYMRAQEEQADRAGVKFLTATGQSPKGMYETFKRLADQSLYQVRYMNPYLQTHPLPTERVAALEGLAKASPYWDHKDSPALQARHDLMRAKLYGFIERADGVARRYPPSDTSLPARYARAIAAYRFYDPRGAQAQIDALIQAQPQNPYF